MDFEKGSKDKYPGMALLNWVREVMKQVREADAMKYTHKRGVRDDENST